MLPNHATILDSGPVDLGWARGTRYTVEISVPVEAGGQPLLREVHTIVRLVGTAVYDLYSSAPSATSRRWRPPSSSASTCYRASR